MTQCLFLFAATTERQNPRQRLAYTRRGLAVPCRGEWPPEPHSEGDQLDADAEGIRGISVRGVIVRELDAAVTAACGYRATIGPALWL